MGMQLLHVTPRRCHIPANCWTVQYSDLHLSARPRLPDAYNQGYDTYSKVFDTENNRCHLLVFQLR